MRRSHPVARPQRAGASPAERAHRLHPGPSEWRRTWRSCAPRCGPARGAASRTARSWNPSGASASSASSRAARPRQHSLVHATAMAEVLRAAGIEDDYEALDEPARVALLARELQSPGAGAVEGTRPRYSPETTEVLAVFDTARRLQEELGTEAVNVYVVSMTAGASDVLEPLLFASRPALVDPGDGRRPRAARCTSSPCSRPRRPAPLRGAHAGAVRPARLRRALCAPGVAATDHAGLLGQQQGRRVSSPPPGSCTRPQRALPRPAARRA